MLLFLSQTAFLFGLQCDQHTVMPASLLHLRLHSARHVLHTRAHTAHTQEARTESGARHLAHEAVGSGVSRRHPRLVGGGLPLCPSQELRSSGDLLLQTGDFPVHFMSALHVRCSEPPARKNPGWQVYTKV